MHTGLGLQGGPSMGAWVTYGLGSECQDLPGFVVLNSGMIPPGGVDCFDSGFLPAAYQGSRFARPASPSPISCRSKPAPSCSRTKLGTNAAAGPGVLARHRHDDRLEAAIANYEFAFRMQSAVPELMRHRRRDRRDARDVRPGRATHGDFGRQCLLARRLVERGVRFIEILPQASASIAGISTAN